MRKMDLYPFYSTVCKGGRGRDYDGSIQWIKVAGDDAWGESLSEDDGTYQNRCNLFEDTQNGCLR